GIGIEPVIHHHRFKPFEGPSGDVVLPQDIPGPPLHTRRCISAASRHVETGPLSRHSDRGLVGSVMPLPILALHHESRKVARSIAEINTVPVKVPFATPIDLSVGIIAFSSQHRETHK